MEKNEVGSVVVVVQNSYIRIRKVLPPKKFRKFSAIKSSWKLETFLDSGLKRRVCLPDKNPEREKESKREGDGM